MYNPKFIVSKQKKESISIQRVKDVQCRESTTVSSCVITPQKRHKNLTL